MPKVATYPLSLTRLGYRAYFMKLLVWLTRKSSPGQSTLPLPFTRMLSTQLRDRYLACSSLHEMMAKGWRSYNIDRSAFACASIYSHDLKLVQSEMVMIFGSLVALSIAAISRSSSLIIFHGFGDSSFGLFSSESLPRTSQMWHWVHLMNIAP